MKKNYIGFLILFFLLLPLHIQAQWISVPSTVSDNLNHIIFTSNDTGFIVGGYETGFGGGVLMRTTDGGQNWSTQSYPFVLRQITFPSPMVGYSVGDSANYGFMIKTTNGGESWSKIEFGKSFALLSVAFINDTIGFIGSTDSKLFKTTNGGQSFTQTVLFTNPISDITFINDSIGFFVGDYFGMFAKTTDQGASWNAIHNNDGIINATSLEFINDSIALVPGMKTLDQGMTWIPSDFNGNGIASRDDVCISVGNNGEVSMSQDMGVSWTYDTITTKPKLLSVAVKPDHKMYAVGEHGVIYKNTSTASTNQHDKDVDISIYPNPSFDEITLVGNAATGRTLMIHDARSRLYFSKTNIESTETIGCSLWAAGVYFVSIYDNEMRVLRTTKIIKE